MAVFCCRSIFDNHVLSERVQFAQAIWESNGGQFSFMALKGVKWKINAITKEKLYFN